MKTKLTRSPKIAAQYLLQNELVAFPTETVYGLGANVFEEDAVKKIFAAKGRPADNPLIIHIARFEELDLLVQKISRPAEKLMDAFFPGALTLVLPKSSYVPSVVSAGLATVGVRMPKHDLAKKFLRECGVPVAAPSANLSGKPSSTLWESVKADFDGKISCILQGEPTMIGLESTVVDCSGKTPLVLRSGAISLEELRQVVPTIKVAAHQKNQPPKSPGMKYRHYAPNAAVVLVEHPPQTLAGNEAYIGTEKIRHEKNTLVIIASDLHDYAHHLYTFFRTCDEKNIHTIYCQVVPETGLGRALMERLHKAAKK
jgi:L-threonylcarbamoyladenylate synthase